MKKVKKVRWTRDITIFILMGIVYVFIEVCFTAVNGEMNRRFLTPRMSSIGFSSIYMFFIGGLIGYILGILNEIPFLRNKFNLFFHCLLGTFIITAAELLSGLILNILLHFEIWNYTGRAFNFMGQICLVRSVGFFFLCPVAFWFDDTIKALVYQKGKVYNLFKFYLKTFNLKETNVNQMLCQFHSINKMCEYRT